VNPGFTADHVTALIRRGVTIHDEEDHHAS
jgi:hypothetical protein